jgi:biotin carboxyl carrier protein
MKYIVIVGEHTYEIGINQDNEITIGDEVVDIDFASVGEGGLYSLLVNNESFEAMVEERDGLWNVLMRGDMYEVNVVDQRTQLLRARAGAHVPETGEIVIKSPMPGLIVAIPVEVGQEIEAGQTIIILESMKMENELKAPRAGRIERINVQPRESVEQGKPLIVIV